MGLLFAQLLALALTSLIIFYAIYLRQIKEEVNVFARVRLSVCLAVSKINQKRVHGFG